MAAAAGGDAGSELVIDARGLHKRFKETHAVRGLDLQVRRGEVLGLLGPNGAGKTTTLEMLEGLTAPDEGTVRVLGLDYASQGREIRERIGVQFQSTQLDDKVKVREALAIYGSYYRKPRAVPELLAQLQLQDKAEAQQGKLSGGQRQRLTLGLALVGDPELVFLDEPTTGLDPQARQSLWEIVRRLKAEGRTVLLTTHYMEEAEMLCDRIAIMDQGQVLRLGTPRELIASLEQPSVAEIEFEGPPPPMEPFAQALGRPLEVKGEVWTMRMTDPKTELQSLLACAERESLPLRQLHMRHASLEDVFLQLTGKSLRD